MKPRFYLVCRTCGGNLMSDKRTRCAHLDTGEDGHQRICTAHSTPTCTELCIAPRRALPMTVEFADKDDLDGAGNPKIKTTQIHSGEYYWDYLACVKQAMMGRWPLDTEHAYTPELPSDKVLDAAMELEGVTDPRNIPPDMEPKIVDFCMRHEGHDIADERW